MSRWEGGPPPVVRLHVAEGGVDAPLGGHGVGSGGEELGDDGRLEALLHEAEGGAEAGAARAHHHGVVLVVHHRVLPRDRVVAHLDRAQFNKNPIKINTEITETETKLGHPSALHN